MHLSSLTVLLQGAGKMGMAMLEGWLDGGLKPENTIIFAPRPSPRVLELESRGAKLNTTGGLSPDFVILATKPQVMAGAWPDIAALVPAESAVISLAAGKTLAWLENLTGPRPIVRAMPNTPAAIGKGITGAIANARSNDEVRQGADLLLKASGDAVWLDDESQMDALGAISGCGPAYVFHLVEAMAAAGAANGLPEDLAMRLARQTVIGAGALLEASPGEAAGQLRQNVTSPGGTTQAALEVIRKDEALTALMTEAVAAAVRRSRELAG